MANQLFTSAFHSGFFSILGAISAVTSSFALDPSSPDFHSTPFIAGETVLSIALPNGLKILILEDHRSPTFAFQTWFQVGSRNEKEGRTGLAHFFEHMMFKGTKNHPGGEFDRLLEQAGVVGENAFTSHDYTAYIQELPSNQLELIFQLESDRMVNLTVEPKGFATEREVVKNERRMRSENDPDGRMQEELYQLAYQRHPYHWPIIGYEKDLNATTPEEALAFYRAHYSPNQATLILVGDVSPNEVLKLAQKYYGPIPPQPPEPTLRLREPKRLAPRRKTLPLTIEAEKLLLAYPIPEAQHSDIPALTLIQFLLSGGKSSRLPQALIETGLGSVADAGFDETIDPGLLMIEVNLQKGKTAPQAERVILKELDKLKNTPPSSEELLRAKNKYRAYFYHQLSSPYLKASFLGQTETVSGDFSRGLKRFEDVTHLTAAHIQAAARAWLTAASRIVIRGVPAPSSQKGKR
jgi:zinc protease